MKMKRYSSKKSWIVLVRSLFPVPENEENYWFLSEIDDIFQVSVALLDSNDFNRKMCQLQIQSKRMCLLSNLCQKCGHIQQSTCM